MSNNATTNDGTPPLFEYSSPPTSSSPPTVSRKRTRLWDHTGNAESDGQELLNPKDNELDDPNGPPCPLKSPSTATPIRTDIPSSSIRVFVDEKMLLPNFGCPSCGGIYRDPVKVLLTPPFNGDTPYVIYFLPDHFLRSLLPSISLSIQLFLKIEPCGDSFCRECIDSVLLSSSICPKCKSVVVPSSSVPNQELEDQLAQQLIYCRYISL